MPNLTFSIKCDNMLNKRLNGVDHRGQYHSLKKEYQKQTLPFKRKYQH